jgi:hypothetical protein
VSPQNQLPGSHSFFGSWAWATAGTAIVQANAAANAAVPPVRARFADAWNFMLMNPPPTAGEPFELV